MMRIDLPVVVGTLLQHLDGDPRLRPFAGIVDQIADHLLEILLFAAELRVLRRIDLQTARSLSRLVFSIVRAIA